MREIYIFFFSKKMIFFHQPILNKSIPIYPIKKYIKLPFSLETQDPKFFPTMQCQYK